MNAKQWFVSLSVYAYIVWLLSPYIRSTGVGILLFMSIVLSDYLRKKYRIGDKVKVYSDRQRSQRRMR